MSALPIGSPVAYSCWSCGTTDPLSHGTLCPRALMAGEAELIAAAITRMEKPRLREVVSWAYVNVGPIAHTGISLKERVRRLNAYRDHLDDILEGLRSRTTDAQPGGAERRD